LILGNYYFYGIIDSIISDKILVKNKNMPDDNKLRNRFNSLKIKKEKLEVGEEKIHEKKVEQNVENIGVDVSTEKLKEQTQRAEQLGESVRGIATAASIRKEKEERQKKIEEIMAEDLEDVYIGMSPAEQREFRQKGEETAKEINSLMDKAKFKIRKVVNLIKKWLSIIPGINQFFLEQEAKIKTDEIVKLKNDKLF